MNDGEGRTVIVTGGSSGIGKAIAQSFARSGDRMVIIGRNEERLVATAEDLGPAVNWRRVDVGHREEASAAVEDIAEELGGIDVLVNAAGFGKGFTTEVPLEEAEAIWDQVMDGNLKGSFLMAMAAAPHLARPGGRIVNISSIAAFTGGSPAGSMAYAAAKSGLSGLTYALARKLSPQGITVNTVTPGFFPDTGFFGGGVPEERRRAIIEQTPVARVGRPEDVAAAVGYLASADASFVTGEVLNVNGGWLFGR